MIARFSHVGQQLGAWREAHDAADSQVVCPIDSWPFRPRYTDGRCPLCGWEPPGTVVRLPLSRRVDTFGWMALGLVMMSIVMAVLVAVMYARA